MAMISVSTYRSPLDWFLDRNEDDYETRLDFIARQFAKQPFDVTAFRGELVAKLRRLPYLSPHSAVAAPKTFYQILSEAGVLKVLLHSDTLRELWKCLLLRKIVARDRELEDKGMAVSGHPLKFHEQEARKIYKDLITIREITARYHAHELTHDLEEKLSQEFRNHIDLALHVRSKYQGSRAELLGGRPKSELSTEPRDEGLASQMATYRTLQPKLQNARTEKKGISGIFLCQLSELIGAPPDVQSLNNGESLAKALTRGEA
jgi:hypothetical protein